MPDRELVAAMRAECPGVNLEAEHRVFVDYWIAQPGQRGVKQDWPATWRNWMRRKRDDARPGPARCPAPSRGAQREAELFALATAADDPTASRQKITS